MKKFFTVFVMVLCSLLILGALSSVLNIDWKDKLPIKDDTETKDQDDATSDQNDSANDENSDTNEATSLAFYYQGTPYAFEEGATWREYMNSDSCDIDFAVRGDYVVDSALGGIFRDSEKNYIRADAQIENEETYYFDQARSFSYGSDTVYYRVGMTWQDFMGTPYDTIGIQVHGDDVTVSTDGADALYNSSDEKVRMTAAITHEMYYSAQYDLNSDESGESPSAGDENVQVDPVEPDDLTGGEDENDPEDLPQIDPGAPEGPGAE